MTGYSVDVLRQIIIAAGLTAPDGRPLYRYPASVEQIEALRRMVGARFLESNHHLTAAAFVFWAAEHFRAKFPAGDHRRWDFIFAGLGIPVDEQLGARLVDDGLKWWKRQVRLSESRRHMFVYSLLAEGGLPQALLAQEGLYRRVVLGLLWEIEAEGANSAGPHSERMAARWITALPQTFQTADFARLLAELAITLASLRAKLPEDLSGVAAERWLDRHHRNWSEELPLRMSPEIVEQLIRPALGSARSRIGSAAPLVVRELCRDAAGVWRWFLRLRDCGFLPTLLLPAAVELRLRLLPVSADFGAPVVYTATPDQGGWQIRRFGAAGTALLPLEPHVAFAFGAFSDARLQGEIVVAPGMPGPAESPSLWRAADPSEGGEATRLVLQPGSGRTRAAYLWLAASETAEAVAGEGVSLESPEIVTGGKLWRISGRGSVTLGTQLRFNVETESSEEPHEARLLPVGEILPVWRTKRDRGPVYRGRPRIFGETGLMGWQQLPDRVLHFVPAEDSVLGEQFVDWMERGEIRARLRLTCLPQAARLSLTESSAGCVVLTAEGLPRGLRLTLRSGTGEARADLPGDAGKIDLATSGVPPGQLELRLADVGEGATLHLVAPWPSRSGLVLDPDGNRLERDQPIAMEALHGWRAIVPEGLAGDLVLHLVGHPAVALPVAGEVPLYPYAPLIRAMLAQGGPDSQVNLNLVVDGREGRRLEIRRYHDNAIVEDDRLRTGNSRDVKVQRETVLAVQLERRPLTLHAIDLTAPDNPVFIESTPCRDLRKLLGDAGGPWLIQSRLQGRVQRAVVWPSPKPGQTRDERIARCATQWCRLLDEPEQSKWEQLWHLVASVGQGGDAGVADQVQALAQAPAAAAAFTLRVPQVMLADALALDEAAPFFWPALPIADFVKAIQMDITRRQARLKTLFEPNEAADEAQKALADRIEAILSARPELAGHFGAALVRAKLMDVAVALNGRGSIKPLFIPNPLERLNELAQMAARRFDRLPTGIGRIPPRRLRPQWSAAFDPDVQSMVDAPLTAAEFAASLRPSASAGELIALINLRWVDPGYFDAALPAAVTLALKEASQ